MTKHHRGEGVSNNELEDTRKNQKDPSEENENSAVSSQSGTSCLPLELTYVNAAPPPPAPLQAIKQHERGVVVRTKAPRPL